MKLEQRKQFLINFSYWGLIAILGYLGIRYILPVSLPFVFGFLFAYLIIGLSKKLGIRNRLLRVLLALLFYGAIGFFIGYFSYRFFVLISRAATWIPELYNERLVPWLTELSHWGEQFLSDLDPTVSELLHKGLDNLLSGLSSLVSFLSSAAVSLISNAATGVPSTILSILAMIFSTIFVVADSDRIREFAQANLPGKWKDAAYLVRDYLTNTLLVVIRSYMLIMLLTFTELTILFWLFGISHPAVKASVIALLDILPLLGTGGIMIPWAVISMITGSLSMGLKLLAIYGIVTLVRNYVEPRIVGTQLGLHPIITLVSMFLGLRLFGFLGMFGLPVAISFFWKQYRSKKASEQPPKPESAEESEAASSPEETPQS